MTQDAPGRLVVPLPREAGLRVLVTRPGPGISQTVHALLDQGAAVTVAPRALTGPTAPTDPTDPAAQLHDLASRGLIALDDAADPAGFDLVLRDRSAATPAAAPSPAPEAAPVAPDAPGAPIAPVARSAGEVVLVGGGPGSPGLLTVAGLDAIRRADVLVCDRLAPLASLDQAPAGAEIIHVGKIPRGEFTPQETINALLVEHAQRGRVVVRLKGGDGFVFGRGGEEWNACVEAGVPVSVIPGVTSSVAAPALAGIPVTHRSLTQGFVVVSGHVPPGDPRCTTDWGALAGCGLTLVVLMGVSSLPAVAACLIEHGMPGDTPAACVADAGLPSQRRVVATLSTLPEQAARAGLGAPAVTIIGPTVTALA